jgi:putative ABC transport system permease protein
MTNFAILFRQFILRAMWREKARAVIVMAGISLGVAVMIAIRLANRSATDSFRAAVDSVGGAATLRIRGSGGRFDELLLRDLFWLHKFGQVSPVVETYAMLAPARGQNSLPVHGEGQMLHVLGVDVLEDAAIRQYRLVRTSSEDRDPTTQELLRLLTEPDAVVLTEKFARRNAKSLGDRIELVFGSTRKEFFIRGLLRDEGPARAVDGNFVLMDIAAAQWAAGQLGFLDRVDLKLAPDRNQDEAREEIARRLPAGLVIETPADGLGRAETMIAAFHFNLTALSGIALVVGLMLIYNSMSVSVAARRDEIGMLQAVGATRRTVLALFLSEAALLAVLGAALGLALGVFLARWAVAATTQTVETFYATELAAGAADSLAIGRSEILMAVAASLGVSLLAAALPAWRAAGVQPLDVIRPSGEMRENARAPRRYLLWACALALLGLLATRVGPIAGRPVCGFLAQFLLAMAGVCLVPGLLASICRFVRDHLAVRVPRFPIAFQLAASNLNHAVSRVSISIAALSVSLAMMVSVAVMVGSFRETVVYWLNSTLHADLFIRPTMLISSLMDAHIDPEAVERIRRDPDVVSTGWFYGRQVPYEQRTVRLAATDVNALIDQEMFVFKAPADPSKVRAALGSDSVLISESFSLRFGKGPGDRFLFPVAGGTREFRVAAVYYDYASNQGTVLMDGPLYAQCFGEANPAVAPCSLSVYLRRGADPQSVRDRLSQVLGERQQLYISTNDNVHQEALRIFDSSFTITYALELIAILIAALGVVSTLITLIYERQREIALLALAGATPGQIRGMVVFEALLIGVVSQVMGILIGLVLAVVLIYVINVQSFAWTIQFHLPVVFLLQSTAVILATTVVCGLYPAARAAQIQALKVTREE